MHELSIAQNIIEIAEKNISSALIDRVRTIRLRVGDAAGVVVESLEFCYNALIQNTALKNSRLFIEQIPFTIFCTSCESVTKREDIGLTCPKCGSNRVEINAGLELDVINIEVEETTTGDL